MLCLALSYVLGVSNLKSHPITWSEANSIKHLWTSHSGPTLGIPETIASVYRRSSDHRPGYFVLLNLWSRLAGRDIFALRLLSVYFGLLALVLAYRLGMFTGSADTAIDAAIITACLSLFVYYTYTVRMYSFLAMATAWVAWSYWKVSTVESPVPRRHWMNFTLACLAIPQVHYFGLIVLAAAGVYHLFFARKTRRWLQTSLVFMLSGLLFLLMLRMLMLAMAERNVPSSDALSLIDSVSAISSLFNNGLSFLLPVAGIAAALNYKRLGGFRLFIFIFATSLVLLMLAANELTPLLIDHRIRYAIIFALPWACALAIGLSLLPGWRFFRIPFLILWIAAFAAYSRSDELLLYTDWLSGNHHKMPHIQNLLYEPAIVTNETDYIASFHPDTPLTWQIPSYYGQIPGKWSGLIHLWTNDDGDAEIQSSDGRYSSLDSMSTWRFPVWLVYNPQQTDLGSIPAYVNAFAQYYHSCGRYVEKPLSVIERYAPNDIPCALLTSPDPLAIQYDNGTELGNIVIELDSDVLHADTWWTRTDFGVNTYSLQIFDREGAPAALQTDNLIGESGLYAFSLNISSLPAGEYVVKLIVYDTSSMKSQPGLVVGPQTHFQREVEVGSFIIGE